MAASITASPITRTGTSAHTTGAETVAGEIASTSVPVANTRPFDGDQPQEQALSRRPGRAARGAPARRVPAGGASPRAALRAIVHPL
ncbi:hypothetical protein GCM10020220_041820 [Nonomuraea rubra]